MCNGHADMCNKTENSREYKCNCRHNTCGRNCERCCPPFIQKKWRPATKNDNFECERKQIFNTQSGHLYVTK